MMNIRNKNSPVPLMLLLFLAILFQDCQQSKTNGLSINNKYYPTGELHHRISIKDSLLHGISTTFYRNGNKKYEKSFYEDVPIDHHYYYSVEGDLLAYNFYDVRGDLRYQLLFDTLTKSYTHEGKTLYIQGAFKENYNEGDSISLIPIVANPFKMSYNVILLTENERIKKSYDFNDSNSPLFLYFINEGDNSLKIISELNDDNGKIFKRDTISLDLIGE